MIFFNIEITLFVKTDICLYFSFQFNLTCDSTPGNTKFYTTPDNYILITLHKLDHTKFAYNFIFNISLTGKNIMVHVMKKSAFPYAKTKVQISCAVTAQLISVFVFAT